MQAEDLVSGEITIAVGGQPLRLQLSVPAGAVKPQVMLPVFQKLANTFTDIAVRKAEEAGGIISCQKGCGACCRQPIPLMEVEIYYIATLINRLPEPRRTEIIERFTTAASHFKENGWQQQFEAVTDEAELKAANRAYFFEGIACPFLEEESCSIYLQRPVACREFMVTSLATACFTDEQEDIQKIPVEVSALTGLSHFGTTGSLSPRNFLPMVFAPDWVAQHPDRFAEKPGPEWLAEFFG